MNSIVNCLRGCSGTYAFWFQNIGQGIRSEV